MQSQDEKAVCRSGATLTGYRSKCLLSQVHKEQLVEIKEIQSPCTSDSLSHLWQDPWACSAV